MLFYALRSGLDVCLGICRCSSYCLVVSFFHTKLQGGRERERVCMPICRLGEGGPKHKPSFHTPSKEQPQIMGGPLKARGFDRPLCPDEEERARERERERRRERERVRERESAFRDGTH